MKIDRRIPEPVQPVIKDYVPLIEQRLVGLINGSYIIGSIALGEFNEYFSDIDFITVLSRSASPIDLGHLRKNSPIHRKNVSTMEDVGQLCAGK